MPLSKRLFRESRCWKIASAFLITFWLHTAVSAETIDLDWNLFAGEISVSGYADGEAEDARFSYPIGIGTDAEGNIYVADSGNNVVRRISPSGQVSTLAGKPGEANVVDGNAQDARFGDLRSLNVSADGTVYVVDTGRVRKVTPDGDVTTIAGNPAGSRIETLGQSLPALEAEFPRASGIALNSHGDVFVADYDKIIRISDGIASVFLTADSPGINHPSLSLDHPEFGPDGNLYFYTPSPDTVYRAGPDGVAEPVVSPALAGIKLRGFTLTQDGQIWFTRRFPSLVGLILSNNEISTVAQFDLSGGSRARFVDPGGLAPAPDGGVFLTDTRTHSVQHLSPDGTSIVIAGQGAKLGLDGALDEAVFLDPTAVKYDGVDSIYVADHFRIRKIDLTRERVTTVLDRTETDYPEDALQFIEIDQQGGLILSNFPENCISRLQFDGTLSILAGEPGNSSFQDGPTSVARFIFPRELRQDEDGNIYVIDGEPLSGAAIRRITPNGLVETIAGTVNEIGSRDGVGPAARFVDPTAMGISPNNSIWIADFAAMRHVTPQGGVTTFSDGTQSRPGLQGSSPEIRFSVIRGMSFDHLGGALVTDTGPVRARRVYPDGSASTFSWNDSPFAPPDDPPFLHGITSDEFGRIYVVDRYSRRLLVGTPTNDRSQLVNLSVRKRIDPSNELLTLGLVVEGSSRGQVLLRAVGPGLVEYGVKEGFLPDPNLTVFDSNGVVVDSNSDWDSERLQPHIFQRVGAFPLVSGSNDAALDRETAAGPFTMVISGSQSSSGEVLAEVYDATIDEDSRLINLSANTMISAEDGRLIAGFVISGNDPKTILVRGVGPELANYGIPSEQVLKDPQIRVFRGGTEIDFNQDWAGSSRLTQVFESVGSFPFSSAASKDAALLIRLNPGAYTVHLESSDDSLGQALLEIYEVR